MNRQNPFASLSGQEGAKRVLEGFLSRQNLPSCVFFGPSGTGKTSMARLCAKALNVELYEFDGASFSVDAARKLLKNQSLFRPMIFIDEIHRLNKAQQDLLLKPLEINDFYFLAATTQDPLYSLSKALQSRLLFIEFKALSESELATLITNESLEESAKAYLIASSAGDARALLNLLREAKELENPPSLNTLKLLRPHALAGARDEHFELASAFIKSMRGSDANAALLYLARLLAHDADIVFIARRMVIFASEDVGLADANALPMATACLVAVQNTGLPEARIMLAHCCVYLSRAPKNNSAYMAINKAQDYVANSLQSPVPNYLINTHPDKAKYIYPHEKDDSQQVYAPNCPDFLGLICGKNDVNNDAKNGANIELDCGENDVKTALVNTPNTSKDDDD